MSNDCSNRPWSNRSRGSRLFLAGFLIVAGTLLFLSNLGILPIRSVWLYWPLIVIGFGISRIIRGPELPLRLFGGLLTLVGSLFLLINLNVIRVRVHDNSWPISILLICLGLVMLFKILDQRDPRPSGWAGFRPPRMGARDGLSDFTLLGSVKRRIDATDFSGGTALSVLGSLELDLRHARTSEPGQTIQLEVSAILGAAKIRVPEHWRIQMRGTSIMGTYEDKTIPPNAGSDAPTLVITGISVMSSIEVED
jgi:hypothetical protein